jgi:beta-glucanase (GH16 family)
MTAVTNARGVLLSYSTASLHHFSATGAGPLLEGTDGPDSFWGDNGVTVTLAGGAGDDIYNIYGPRNTVLEQANAGIDAVKTWMSYRLPAQVENLTVTGSDRQAVGNELDNIITGGNGTQTLDGGAGDDVLFGEAGADVFAVKAGNGSDLIADFTGEDSVRLTGYGFTSFNQIAARLTQQGDDAVLDLGNGEILAFADTAVGEFTAGQFALEIDLSGMTQTFADGFDVLSLGEGGTWDSNFWWGAENGSTIESQVSWYIDTDYGPTQSLNPFSVDDGVLSITAQTVPADLQLAINGYDYASGLLNTYGSFSQTYGYFEIRADMPEGTGIWPAFWLLPADGSWPPELDVIELAAQEPGRLIMTSHSEASGSHTIDRHHAEVADTAGFHTYGVLWGPEELTWTYDGIVVAQTQTPADMHEPMYMLVNLGLGGFTGTPGDALNDGVQMKVDYIRAYALDGDVPGEPTPPPGTEPPANAGNDSLVGTAGADTLDGGDGNDVLRGLAGDDMLLGGDGDDTLQGGGGSDTYHGGSGSDTVSYSGASKSLFVDLAADIAKFYDGSEQLVSIENVIGGTANDTLAGDSGANRLDGGDGNDALCGLAGDDLLLGGGGDDSMQGGDGTDTYDGGAGSDTVSYSAASKSLFVDLTAGIANFSDGSEQLVSIESVTGGKGNDTLVGDSGANRLHGGAGNDVLRGLAGDDVLDGGLGADRFHFAALDLAGGDGRDTIVGFERNADILSFSDLVDADDDGTTRLDDLLASVTSVTDTGVGGDVTVAFDNGAAITFAGAGTGVVDSLTDLVNDATTQIQVS